MSDKQLERIIKKYKKLNNKIMKSEKGIEFFKHILYRQFKKGNLKIK